MSPRSAAESPLRAAQRPPAPANGVFDVTGPRSDIPVVAYIVPFFV